MQSYHYELYEINLPFLDKKVKQDLVFSVKLQYK